MRNLALVLMLLSPSVFAADYDITEHLPRRAVKAAKYQVDPGVVVLDGVVEVPLYRAWEGGMAPLVAVTLPGQDDTSFMPIALQSQGITVTEGFAGAAGAKIQTRKGGAQVAVIPEMNIGDLTLLDVAVQIGGQNELGLPAFRRLAVALLPSQGVVRFAPAEQAAELLSAVGEAQPYTRNEGYRVKWKRSKIDVPGETFVLDGQVNGVDGPVYLSTSAGSLVAKASVSQDSAYTVGVNSYYVNQLGLGAWGDYTLVAPSVSNPPYMPQAAGLQVGSEITAAWDIAYDPSQQLIAIKPQSKVAYVSTWELTLADALRALDMPESPEGEEAGETPDLSGAYTSLSGLYRAHGDYSLALEYADKVLAAKPESCSSYLLVGKAQAGAGKYKAALKSLKQAGTRYDAWAGLSIEDRGELAEAAIEDPSLEAQIQTHACFDAWGRAAQVALQLGDLEQVQSLFKDHADLDASLPMAAAMSYLAQERYADADAAMRQVLLLERGTTQQTALTVAIVDHARGKTQVALDNYYGAARQGGLPEARALGTAAAQLGDMETLESLTAVSPHMALAFAQAQDSARVDSAAAWKQALSQYETALVLNSDDPQVWAGYGQAMLASGETAKAAQALKSGLAVEPQDAELLLLAGDLAADSGDYDKARKLYLKAAKASPMTASYAGLLALK